MGVIRKKTATRGGEGGVKYICDVCSADITSTVRIRCAHSSCSDYDLCVLCFSTGKSSSSHQPATHSIRVIEQNSVPIYDPNWGADEELLLLEGAEIYGLGSWADIADHIGGFRNKDEVKAHYDKVYLKSNKFPLPENASPHNTKLLQEISRDHFQKQKKRRIEDRKEAAKSAPPAVPKQKPTASVPSCHEVQGYMPGRLEFESEYANDAEEAVQLMQFDPGDGINTKRGEMEPEMELKMTVMDIYNQRLTQRAERKKVIFEHNLLEYRKNTALEKKRTKEERELLNKAKPFARMMNHDDFQDFNNGLIEELNLRQALSQLADWRAMKIEDLRAGEKYEQEKITRAQKAQPMGSMDRERFASSQRSKAPPVIETPSGTAALLASSLSTSPAQSSYPNKDNRAPLANGHANTNGGAPLAAKQKHQIQSLPTGSSIVLSQENASDLQLLTKDEIELCEKTRIFPKPYLVIKDTVLREAVRGNGMLKKKHVREISKVDSAKGGRIFDFFVAHGWLGKA